MGYADRKYHRRIVSYISLILPNSLLHLACLQLINLGACLGASSCLEIRGLTSCVISGYTVVFLGSSCLIPPQSPVIFKLRHEFAGKEACLLQELHQH